MPNLVSNTPNSRDLQTIENGQQEALSDTDPITRRMDAMWERIEYYKAKGMYFHEQPIEQLDGPWVHTGGERKLMFSTYNYLGLLKHPHIAAAAMAAIEQYGTGTHGVRMLGGTLDLHKRLEARIANFTQRQDAIIFTSGYVTNLTTISTLVGRNDWVISDRWNHASIVDGCLLAQGDFKRFRHNDMQDLERVLRAAPAGVGKLVVADAVFSMDGDIFNLPEAYALCQRYGAHLMIDEAHSIGVLGRTGHGIEEHFDMPGSIDLKMGTLSKTLPGVGGYIAGTYKLTNLLRNASRAFVFSAAMAPPVAAALLAAFDVLEQEGVARIEKLSRNVEQFISGLQQAGFDTGFTSTPIVPIMVGIEERAGAMTAYCQQNGVFVLPVVPPAVPEGTARLRANVTAEHSAENIDFALEIFIQAGKLVGVI